MDRERAAWLKDRIRGFAQGVVENLEVMWQEWAEDFTEEEFDLCHAELARIAARIGNIRTFVSVSKNAE